MVQSSVKKLGLNEPTHYNEVYQPALKIKKNRYGRNFIQSPVIHHHDIENIYYLFEESLSDDVVVTES